MLFRKTESRNKRVVIYLTGAGFFSINWLTSNSFTIGGLSLEALYFFLLLSLVFIYLLLLLQKHNWTIYPSPELKVYSSFLLVSLISIAWSISPYFTIREVVSMTFPLMIYQATRYQSLKINVPESMKRTLLILMSFSMLTIGMQFLQGNARNVLFQTDDFGITDTQGFFFPGPTLASALVFICLAQNRHKKRNTKNVVTAIICLTYIFFLSSKTYFLSTMIAIAGHSTMVSSKLKSALIASFSIVLLASVLITDNVISRTLFWQPGNVSIEQFSEADSLQELPVNSSGRFHTWDYALRKASENTFGLWLGVGWGNSRAIMKKSPFKETYIHGDYVRIIVELGFIGLFWYIGIMLTSLFLLRKRYMASRTDPTASICIQVVMMILIYCLASGITYETVNKYRTLHTAALVMLAALRNHTDYLSLTRANKFLPAETTFS